MSCCDRPSIVDALGGVPLVSHSAFGTGPNERGAFTDAVTAAGAAGAADAPDNASKPDIPDDNPPMIQISFSSTTRLTL
jgi:hypothetical protein